MAYKIQFDNGHVVEFDAQPSDADIDEAYAHTKSLTPPQAPPEGPGFGERLKSVLSSIPESFSQGEDVRRGLGEAGLQLATAAPAMVVGPVRGLINAAKGASPKEAEDIAALQMQHMTFEPRTEKGKEYSEAVGDVMNKYIIPIAPMLHGFPAIKAGEAANAVKARLAIEPKKATPLPSNIEALKAELNAPETAAVEPTNGAGAFQNITDQLGYKEGEASPLRTKPPMVDVADQLTQSGEESRGSAADRVLADRQTALEQEVKQRTAREQEATLRATQENAPVYSPEYLKHQEEASKQEASLKQETLHQEELVKRHEQALAEQAKIAEAQRAVEERQKAVERSVEPAGDAFKARRALNEQTSLRNDLGKRSPFSKTFLAEKAAKEKALALEKERAQVDQRRVENEQLIQQLRDEHSASTDRANEAQRILDERNTVMQQEVAKQTSLDLSAAERVRQEQGTLPPAVGPLKGFNAAMQAKKGRAVKKSQKGGLLIDWGSKNKFQGMKGPIGDVLKDIGHALIKTPEQAIELSSKVKDVSQNMVQKGINAWTKGGAYLAAKVDHPLVHFVVDRFLTADDKAHAAISEKLHGEYLDTVRSLSKDQRQQVGELLNLADLNQKPLTPEMMNRFGLDPAMQKMITTHQNAMAEALAGINKVRASLGKDPIKAREAYSAMSLDGDYRKVVRKPVLDEMGKPELNADGTPKLEVVGVISANSRSGMIGHTLEKLEKSLSAKDPSLVFGELVDKTLRKSSAEGTPHGAFQDALKTLGEDNPHIAEFLDLLRDVSKDDVKNYMGMQKHMMQKKGVFGMEGRKPWLSAEENATAFFENQVKYIEGVTRWNHLAEAALDVNKALQDPSMIKNHPEAIKLSERYMQNALGLNPSRFGKALEEAFNTVFSSDLADKLSISPSRARGAMGTAKAVINTSLLSFNPMFLAIQGVQGIAGMPGMTALLRSRGLAPKHSFFTGGMDSMVKGTLVRMKDPSSLAPFERAGLKYAKENHVYATDMVEHNAQISKNATYYATKITQSPAAVLEQATRAQTFHALVDMLHESGLRAEEGLYEQAHRFTNDVMNNYNALEKPAIYDALGPIGSMAYNLKSFGHNEISRWSLYAREIANAPKGEKLNASQALLTQMATTILIGGVIGIPFFAQWEGLYDYITDKLDTPRSLTMDVIQASEAMGKHLPAAAEYTLSHGLLSMLGVDLSRSLGLGDVIPSSVADAIFSGGTKGFDMIRRTYGALTHPDEAHAKAALVAVALPIAAGLLKDMFYTKDGKVYSSDPDKPVGPALATMNKTDERWKLAGRTGIHESVEKEKTYINSSIDKKYQDIRDKGITRLSQDIFNNRPLSEAGIKAFLRGQGDPNTLPTLIAQEAEKQGYTRAQVALIKDISSKNLSKLYSAQRRVQ